MAEPSKKDEGIEQFIKDNFGFDRRAIIRADKCAPPPTGCGGDAKVFRDELSKKEYTISGLCQTCQDRVFGPHENED